MPELPSISNPTDATTGSSEEERHIEHRHIEHRHVEQGHHAQSRNENRPQMSLIQLPADLSTTGSNISSPSSSDDDIEPDNDEQQRYAARTATTTTTTTSNGSINPRMQALLELIERVLIENENANGNEKLEFALTREENGEWEFSRKLAFVAAQTQCDRNYDLHSYSGEEADESELDDKSSNISSSALNNCDSKDSILGIVKNSVFRWMPGIVPPECKHINTGKQEKVPIQLQGRKQRNKKGDYTLAYEPTHFVTETGNNLNLDHTPTVGYLSKEYVAKEKRIVRFILWLVVLLSIWPVIQYLLKTAEKSPLLIENHPYADIPLRVCVISYLVLLYFYLIWICIYMIYHAMLQMYMFVRFFYSLTNKREVVLCWLQKQSIVKYVPYDTYEDFRCVGWFLETKLLRNV